MAWLDARALSESAGVDLFAYLEEVKINFNVLFMRTIRGYNNMLAKLPEIE